MRQWFGIRGAALALTFSLGACDGGGSAALTACTENPRSLDCFICAAAGDETCAAAVGAVDAASVECPVRTPEYSAIVSSWTEHLLSADATISRWQDTLTDVTEQIREDPSAACARRLPDLYAIQNETGSAAARPSMVTSQVSRCLDGQIERIDAEARRPPGSPVSQGYLEELTDLRIALDDAVARAQGSLEVRDQTVQRLEQLIGECTGS